MLYTGFVMNSKPNIPEEVIPGRNYSFWADLKVNGWMLVAMLSTGAGDLWLHQYKDVPFSLRLAITLFPLPAGLLWARDVVRWMRSMDELHRRITLEACLFATGSTLFVITAWERFRQAGILESVFQPSRLHFEQINFAENVLTLGLVYFFYFLGHAILNRRYK